MFRDNNKSQSGTSLYLVIIITTIFLAIVLGLSTIFLSQLVTLREMGYSVIAFYAADAGIEKVLMNRVFPSSICTESSPCSLGGAKYYLDIRDNAADSSCPNYCIKSIGTYQGVSRAIEITY